MKHPLRNTVLYVAGSIVVAALLGTPFSARAAGLGELKLHSRLGQPLNAEIELLAMTEAERNVQARLVPVTDHETDPALSSIRFSIVESGARPTLKVSTRQALVSPFVELPVEVSFGTTRVLRRYTLLLDPPAPR